MIQTRTVSATKMADAVCARNFLGESASDFQARLRLQLEALKSWQTEVNLWKTEGGGEPPLRLKDILGVVMCNDDHTIQDLHDTLKYCYKVARKRFVDAVCLQAVDYFLVSGKTSPL